MSRLRSCNEGRNEVKLVYEILAFLLKQEVSRMKSDVRGNVVNLGFAYELQGRLEYRMEEPNATE